jgi:hypothetical protein
MPRDTETFIIPLGGWTGGLNRDAFELQLAPEETPDALNIDFGLRGEFEQRPGYAVASTGAFTAITQYLCTYEPSTGTDLLLAVQEDGDIWYASALAFTDSLQTFGAAANQREWPIEAAMLDDSIFLFSLRSTTRRWDNATWVNITSTTLDETGTAASPQAPKAATAVTHHSRIFVGSVEANSSVDRSRVMWSTTPVENAGDAGANRWKATAFIDVNQDDGTEVRKLASFQSNLVIFKDHSFYVLAGQDEDSFSLYPVDASVGCISPRTVAYDDSEMFFFDASKGVYRFDGVKVIRIDESINNYILSGINASLAYKASGYLADGKYFLSVPWGSDTYNSRTFVFDTVLRNWAEYDIGWFAAARWTNVHYTGGNKNTNGVFDFRQGTVDDNAVAFNWHLETVWFPPAAEQGMTYHRLRRADLWVEADGGAMTIEAWVDGTESAVWTQNITASTNRILLPAVGQLWEIIKFKFSGTSS